MKFASFFAKFFLLLCLAAPEFIHAAGTVSLQIGKSASTTNAPVGAAVQFNIGMTNNSFFTASGITGSDIMPGGFEITGWTSTIVGQSSPPAYNTNNGQWTVATLAPGNSALLPIFTVASTGGTYTNVATYISPVTNGASVVVTVVPQIVQADLAITTTASPNPASVSQSVVFNLALQNLGPDNILTNIVVTDCLPTGFQYVTDSTTGGETPGTYNPSACAWTLPGGLPANTAVSLSITAQAVAAGTFTDTASVAVPAGITDQNPNNNSSSATVTVNASSGTINLVCSSNITVAAAGPNGAPAVFYSSTASGGCSTPTITFNPASGSIFPIGTNLVTCTASDTCGDQASCAFTVTVTPPPLTLICSPNLTIAATNTSGAVVVYYTTVSDGCNGAHVVSTPPSGSLFPVGPTLVNCSATENGRTTCTEKF